MAEWLKAHDSKSCKGQPPFEGSNPSSSAKKKRTATAVRFFAPQISHLPLLDKVAIRITIHPEEVEV